MEASQFTELLANLNAIGDMIGGLLVALIVAVTWRG